jgi:hypothetical protein
MFLVMGNPHCGFGRGRLREAEQLCAQIGHKAAVMCITGGCAAIVNPLTAMIDRSQMQAEARHWEAPFASKVHAGFGGDGSSTGSWVK